MTEMSQSYDPVPVLERDETSEFPRLAIDTVDSPMSARKAQIVCDSQAAYTQVRSGVHTPEALRAAFEPLKRGDTLYVCCSDGRCDTETGDLLRFGAPGSFVTRYKGDIAVACTLLQELEDAGIIVKFVDIHDGCGALKLQCGINRGNHGCTCEPTALAHECACTIDEKVHGMEHVRMGYDPITCKVAMCGSVDLHHERVLTVDLSNRCWRPSHLGAKGFKLNRYTNDVKLLIDDILLLTGIAMDETHGMGRTHFAMPGQEFVINIMGDPTVAGCSYDDFRSALINRLPDELAQAVVVVGFDAPAQ